MSKYRVTLEDGSKYIITTEGQEKKTTSFLPKEQEVEQKISGREDSVSRLRKEVATPYDFGQHPFKSTLKPLVTGLKTMAVPIQRTESALAGLGLGLQKGQVGEGFGRFKQGLFGQKQQELGDLVRTTGFGGEFNEPLAATSGFVASLVTPIESMRKANKALSSIQRASDKGLLSAGNALIQGSDDAVRAVGSKLDDVYSKFNTVQVNANKILDDIVKLPKTVIEHIETEAGTKLDDLLSNFNMANARKLKHILGQLKPNVWGKGEKGLIENVQDMQLNRAYGSIKKAMQEALNNTGMSKEADRLLQADEAFTDTMRASQFIKKTIIDPTLRKPTKTGSMALRMAKEGDLSGRVALNTLKAASREASKNIMKAVNALDKYNSINFLLGQTKRLGSSAITGGAAGLLGGKIIGEFSQ